MQQVKGIVTSKRMATYDLNLLGIPPFILLDSLIKQPIFYCFTLADDSEHTCSLDVWNSLVEGQIATVWVIEWKDILFRAVLIILIFISSIYFFDLISLS